MTRAETEGGGTGFHFMNNVNNRYRLPLQMCVCVVVKEKTESNRQVGGKRSLTTSRSHIWSKNMCFDTKTPCVTNHEYRVCVEEEEELGALFHSFIDSCLLP